jgi:hypothetical protein
LVFFLKSLPEDSYFNIISFGTNSSKMFEESMQYGADTVADTIKTIDSMNADMGST